MTHKHSTYFNAIAHRDTIMAKEKRTFGKRFSQFMTKMLWHLDQQPAPNYSCVNQKHSTSSKKSNIKHGSKHPCQNSSIDRNYYVHNQYPSRCRTYPVRNRTTTLTSIIEE